MSLGFWKNKSFISFLIYFERDRHSCLFPFNLLFFSKRLYCNVTTAVLLGRFKTSWHCQKKSIYLHEKETKQNEVNNKKSWNTQKHSILIECMYNLSKPKSIFTHSEWPRFIFTIYDTITLQRRLLNFFTVGCADPRPKLSLKIDFTVDLWSIMYLLDFVALLLDVFLRVFQCWNFYRFHLLLNSELFTHVSIFRWLRGVQWNSITIYCKKLQIYR